jgi:hypothetical protein
MRLEAVTVSVGYGDFLAATLPYNLAIFDRMVVVTTPEDAQTREVCRRHGVAPIVTREFYRHGDKFNKGRGVNKGIDQLSHADWICHLDADILLPPYFRRVVRDADLQPECLYGCDRVMIRSWSDWKKLQASGYLQHDYHCRVNFPKGLEVGCRWASEEHGYVPLGFFQLWHAQADLHRGAHMRAYPTSHHDAARGDVQFAIKWDRRQRVLLPEVIAVHLESETAPLGANWKGRKTKKFGPE